MARAAAMAAPEVSRGTASMQPSVIELIASSRVRRIAGMRTGYSLCPRAGRGWGEGALPLGAELRIGMPRVAPHAKLTIAESPPHPRSLRSLDLSPRGGERYFFYDNADFTLLGE